MIVVASFFICTLICITCFWTWSVYLKKGHKLPPFYPGILPIIGHIHILAGDGVSLWRFIKNVAADTIRQGGVISLFLGHKLYYFISDPEDALTAANACLQKNFTYDFAKPWLGDGLITASGEIWKHHRKLLTPAFSLPVIYGFLDVFNNQSRKFVEILKYEVGKPINHTEFLRNIALETFCLTAFGIEDSLEDKDFIQKYMHATECILGIITSRFQNFWLQNDFIFKLCGLKTKQDKHLKVLNAMSDKVIQAKKMARYKNGGNNYVTKTNGIIYKPFLDLLIELSEENALSDKEIREEVDTAIITGFDTTSTLLSYIMILLGTNPRVQEKAYNEIMTVLATDRDVTREDIQNLIYIEAVIKESLRVFTIGPVTLRYVDKDVKLKNYTMRAGSECVILLHGVHRDPIWGKDNVQFRPERWLDPDMPVNPNVFAGFSMGKRYCLGKSFAMTSMKTTLVHVLKRYKIKADDSNLQLRMDFILKPASGHEIYLEERV